MANKRTLKKYLKTVAEELGVPLLGKMPIDVSLTQMVDNGAFEMVETNYLDEAVKVITSK